VPLIAHASGIEHERELFIEQVPGRTRSGWDESRTTIRVVEAPIRNKARCAADEHMVGEDVSVHRPLNRLEFSVPTRIEAD
jgi:hypothetical protein